MSACSLFLDHAPHSGTWNMAMDEALLEEAVKEEQAAVRIYSWELPTVSLGYFQKNEVHPALAHLPRVKRLTGGGAILHHHEITYSCTLPSSHSLADKTEELYEVTHAAIINYLSSVQIRTEMRGNTVHAEGGFHAEPFLCFGRQDARDIVVNENKVLGSAQRRRRGAILQHGSLVLRKSPFATDFPGIGELNPNVPLPELEVMATQIGNKLAEALFSGFESRIFSEKQLQSAEKWAVDKYVHLEWKKN